MPKLWQYSDAEIVTLHTGVSQMNQKEKKKLLNYIDFARKVVTIIKKY